MQHQVSSFSSSSATEDSIPFDNDAIEWKDMNFDERIVLLKSKRAALEDLEQESREYGRIYGYGGGEFWNRVTESFFYYLRIIEKLEKTLADDD